MGNVFPYGPKLYFAMAIELLAKCAADDLDTTTKSHQNQTFSNTILHIGTISGYKTHHCLPEDEY